MNRTVRHSLFARARSPQSVRLRLRYLSPPDHAAPPPREDDATHTTTSRDNINDMDSDTHIDAQAEHMTTT